MRFLTFVAVLLLSASLAAELQEKAVTYSADGVDMTGYLVYDDAVDGTRPGILVVHEWWGHNDYARNRARQLAELGYTALAIDMYGDGKTAEHPKEAGEFAGQVMGNMAGAKARFIAAMKLLKAHQTVDVERIGAIGYCFGGGVVLAMARMGLDLDGVVSFHGSLATQTPARPGEVKADVLVLHGEEDPMVTAEQVEAFKTEMSEAGVDYTFIAYPGATHSFTNPAADSVAKAFDLPIGYDADAARKSWQAMQDFFDRIFSPAEDENEDAY